jgi:hypothetical protein
MNNNADHQNYSQKSIIIPSLKSLAGGALTTIGLRLYFAGQNAQREIGESNRLFKEYTIKATQNSPEAALMYQTVQNTIKPPHTTMHQNFISNGTGIVVFSTLMALKFRKSFARFLTQARKTTIRQSGSRLKSKNDLSL